MLQPVFYWYRVFFFSFSFSFVLFFLFLSMFITAITLLFFLSLSTTNTMAMNSCVCGEVSGWNLSVGILNVRFSCRSALRSFRGFKSLSLLVYSQDLKANGQRCFPGRDKELHNIFIEKATWIAFSDSLESMHKDLHRVI